MNSPRIPWIDFAKGVGMLLVFAGHNVPAGLVHELIYSFHVPLFFFLAGTTLRSPSTWDDFAHFEKKRAKRLLLPALLIWLAMALYSLVRGNVFILRNWIAMLVYAAGADGPIGDAIISPIGMGWFLVVFFLCIQIHAWLHLRSSPKMFPWAVFLFSVGGCAVGRFSRLPLGADLACAFLPFVEFGRQFSKCRHGAPNCIFCGIGWLSLFLFSWCVLQDRSSEWLRRTASYNPLQYGIALCGCLWTCILSALACRKMPCFSMSISAFGRHSMLFYVIHAIDFLWSGIWISARSWGIPRSVSRLAMDFALFGLVLLILNTFSGKQMPIFHKHPGFFGSRHS